MGTLKALESTAYEKDGTAPELSAFSVDMDGGKLVLTFTETIKAASVAATGITLQSAAKINGAENYTLTGAKAKSTADSKFITITLLKNDLDAIKANTKLCTAVSNAFASLTNGCVRDMADNSVVPVPAAAALPVSFSGFTADATAPRVSSFSFDLDGGTFNVVLSEPVSSNINVSEITLCSDAGNQNYTLTDATKFVLSKDQKDVAMVLGVHGLDQIKSRRHLATNVKSTLLTLTSNFAQDKNNNAVVPLAKVDNVTPSNFKNDGQQPRLVSYVLDLDTNELILTFSEAVNSTSIDLSGITLQDSANSTTATSSYSLTGGNVFVPHSNQCPLDGN